MSVTDSAVLTVNGASTYGGTMTFYLCGPTLLAASYAPCTTGGTQIGAVKTVVGTSSTTTVVSDAATITSAGRYCLRADYSGDASVGVPGSSDSSVGECFRVLPLQPDDLDAWQAQAPWHLVSPIDDTATLSGTANDPDGSKADGTITFSLYGPNDDTCASAAIATRVVTLTNGGDGSYKASDGTGSGSLTPAAAGTYRWVASYSGDAPNTLGDSGSCNDANESVVVSPVQPAIITIATGAAGVALGTAISDSATLSNTAPKPDGSPAGGTITFRVYGPNDPTCTGTPVHTSGAVPVSGNGTYSSGSFYARRCRHLPLDCLDLRVTSRTRSQLPALAATPTRRA